MNRDSLRALALLVGCCALLAGATSVLAQESAAAPMFDVKITGEYGPFMPPDVSTTGHRADYLINILHWFMGLLFVGWGAFFTYCLVKFRQRPGHQANAVPIKAKVSKYSEIGVAIFEAVLLIGLSIPVWAEVKEGFPEEKDNPQHVRVVAEQFAWNFHYPGPDGVFGRAGPQFIDMATNILGIDPDDEYGADDIVSGELHVVAGRPVIAQVTSKDVIHSFSIPVLRLKQDTIPGMRIPVWFQTKDDAAGNYEVACAQLCGNNHYTMRALMVIHATQEEADAWLESEKPEEFDEDEFD